MAVLFAVQLITKTQISTSTKLFMSMAGNIVNTQFVNTVHKQRRANSQMPSAAGITLGLRYVHIFLKTLGLALIFCTNLNIGFSLGRQLELTD